jgi:hypothetical protein
MSAAAGGAGVAVVSGMASRFIALDEVSDTLGVL